MRHRDRWVQPGSLGSLGCALAVVGFIGGRLVHSGGPRGSLGASRVVRFTLVLPGGRWFRPVSLRSDGWALWDIGFILGSWGLSDAPWGSKG